MRNPMQTSTWKAVFLLILAALLGGLLGSAATAWTLDRAGRDHGRSRHGSDWYVKLLSRELDLTGTQRDSVRAILKRHRRGMDSLYATLRPGMEERRNAIRADIRTMLTDSQQARYAELSARLDARRREKLQQDTTER
jgi:Spy/CpxP family protein refolding chaperone